MVSCHTMNSQDRKDRISSSKSWLVPTIPHFHICASLVIRFVDSDMDITQYAHDPEQWKAPGGPHYKAPTSDPGADARDNGSFELKDLKKVLKSINKSTKLKWPSKEIQEKAGASGWGSWQPKVGMVQHRCDVIYYSLIMLVFKVGEIIHSWGKNKLFHIKETEGDKYCVVHAEGLQSVTGTASPSKKKKTAEPKAKDLSPKVIGSYNSHNL